MRVQTHYDNLKVAPNATQEVIRDAYVVLADKYSPSRKPGSAEAVRILLLVNTAYEVLSDPKKRRRHDLWIQEQERASTTPDAEFGWRADAETPSTASRRRAQFLAALSDVGAHIHRRSSLYVLAAIAVGAWATSKFETVQLEPSRPYLPTLTVASTGTSSNVPLSERSHQERGDTTPALASYVRPPNAPNGAAWPRSAGYVNGYSRLSTNGLSTVTIDNGLSGSDVFVKLVSLGDKSDRPVRAFFIPDGKIFTLKHITAGSYDIRYEDLSNGDLWRTDEFSLQETPSNKGTQYSDVTMTLYKVPYGNMQTYPISASQF